MADPVVASCLLNMRSRAWFDNPTNAGMTALDLERYMNFGLSLG